MDIMPGKILPEGTFGDENRAGKCKKIHSISFPSTTILDQNNLYLIEVSIGNIRSEFAVWLTVLNYLNNDYAIILFIQGTTQQQLKRTIGETNEKHPIECIMDFIIGVHGKNVGIAISQDATKSIGLRKLRDQYCCKNPIQSNEIPNELHVHLVSDRKTRVKQVLGAKGNGTDELSR